ncbi:MAG: carboxypeptidase regulatory-like domain-containing protein [Planctomycetes bacterium]|nr:carboxypeptidase regulatory-like domain-containing protein [Planctomycetota bacterium]
MIDRRLLLPSAALRSAALLAALAAPASADTLIGQVTNAAGLGVAGVTLSFSNGANPLNPISGANGYFAVVVPAGTYDIAFLPPSGAGLAPRQLLDVAVLGTSNAGVIALQTGHLLQGHVVDALGAPVPNVDTQTIDTATGTTLFTPSDNSNLLGDFSVVVPAGTYEVQLRPGRATLLVPRAIDGVVVSGATNLGTQTLESGVLVTGMVLDGRTSLPIAGVDLDVESATTGETVLTPNDDTDVFGIYTLVLPNGLFHLSYDPPLAAPLLGLERFNVSIAPGAVLGTTTLRAGLVLTGLVTGPGGVPVAGADIDVEHAPGGQPVYTPHDDTDATGRFSVVVPAGSYRVTIGPSFASGLVGVRSGVISLATNTTLPATTLLPGVALTGTILGWNAAPESLIDVDVVDPQSGEEFVTERDDTDALGRYRVIVPAGTWDLRFTPRKLSLSRVLVERGVAIAGPTTLDRQLQLVPMLAYLDTFGVPTVPQGGPLPLVLAFMNPTLVPQTTAASIAFVAPDGTETLLLQPTVFTLPPGAGGAAFLLLACPAIPPALLGRQARFELRFDDSVMGEEQDHDSTRFVIQ